MPVCYRKLNINEISTIRCKFINFKGTFPILTLQLQYCAGIGEWTINKNR